MGGQPERGLQFGKRWGREKNWDDHGERRLWRIWSSIRRRRGGGLNDRQLVGINGQTDRGR